MRIDILSNDTNLIFKYQDRSLQEFLKDFSDTLDHAQFREQDIKFLEQEKTLVINLNRNLYEKMKRYFLWFKVWCAGKDPVQRSILSIRNIKSFEINGSFKNPQEVITIGGININKDKIYISSFCEKESSIEILLTVKGIDITLEDE